MEQLLCLQEENETQLTGQFASFGVDIHYAKTGSSTWNSHQHYSRKSWVLKCLCVLYALKTPRQYCIPWHFSGSLQHFRHTEWKKEETTNQPMHKNKSYVLVPSMAAASPLWRVLALRCINTSQSQPIHLRGRRLGVIHTNSINIT